MSDIGGFRPPRLSVNDSSDRSLGVLVVDTIPLFCAGLLALVTQTSGLRWLGSTRSTRSATVLCDQLRPDIVLIAAALDPCGRFARALIAGNPASTVVTLVCSAYRNDAYVHEAVAAGVHGIVPRSAGPAQLLDGIRRAHRERRYVDPELSVLTGGISRVRGPQSRQPLSRREFQVLELIADGMDNQTIGRALFVSVETVRTHVKSILRKLRARDRAHAVSLAYRTGVLVPQDERVPSSAEPAHGGQDAVAAGPAHAPASLGTHYPQA